MSICGKSLKLDDNSGKILRSIEFSAIKNEFNGKVSI